MAKSSLSLIILKHISDLARISLTTDELNLYQKQLEAVLDHISSVQKVDTKNIEPTFQTTCLKTNFVKRAKFHLPHNLAVSTFKKVHQGFLVVPPSIEK